MKPRCIHLAQNQRLRIELLLPLPENSQRVVVPLEAVRGIANVGLPTRPQKISEAIEYN